MTRGRRRDWAEFMVLLSVGLALAYLAVLLPNRLKTERLRAKRDLACEDVKSIKGEVDRLAREIEAAQGDPWFVEHRLRDELGYLKPGEQVFEEAQQLPTPRRDAAPGHAPGSSSTQAGG